MTLNLRQIPSPNYGGSRGQVIWVILHTAEGSLTVDSLGRYFASKASGVSSHVGIDDHEIVQYVPYSGQAWTARSANPVADQAELCGFAAWTRAAWLKHPGMLENTARWIADRCTARGIPATKIGPGNVAARQPGVIGHVDITNGLHDGTHTDPGTTFPWDVVMARVNQLLHPTPEDDMTPEEHSLLVSVHDLLTPGVPHVKYDGDIYRKLTSASAGVAQLLAQDPTVSAQDIADAIPADIAQQVVDALGKRLNQPT